MFFFLSEMARSYMNASLNRIPSAFLFYTKQLNRTIEQNQHQHMFYYHQICTVITRLNKSVPEMSADNTAHVLLSEY